MNTLAPKKRKYKKAFGGKIKGIARSGYTLSGGDFGLKALEPYHLEAKQIEAARTAIRRSMKRAGLLWIRVFPDHPVSKKALEIRMGSGKGAVDHWAARIRPGRILIEIAGVSEAIAREALRLGANKLPVATKIIARGDVNDSYEVDNENNSQNQTTSHI